MLDLENIFISFAKTSHFSSANECTSFQWYFENSIKFVFDTATSPPTNHHSIISLYILFQLWWGRFIQETVCVYMCVVCCFYVCLVKLSFWFSFFVCFCFSFLKYKYAYKHFCLSKSNQPSIYSKNITMIQKMFIPIY